MLVHAFVPHFAYLDPGTGSMIVQSVVGVAAGVAVFGRRAIANVFRKTKALFSRGNTSSEK